MRNIRKRESNGEKTIRKKRLNMISNTAKHKREGQYICVKTTNKTIKTLTEANVH